MPAQHILSKIGFPIQLQWFLKSPTEKRKKNSFESLTVTKWQISNFFCRSGLLPTTTQQTLSRLLGLLSKSRTRTPIEGIQVTTTRWSTKFWIRTPSLRQCFEWTGKSSPIWKIYRSVGRYLKCDLKRFLGENIFSCSRRTKKPFKPFQKTLVQSLGWFKPELTK